MKRYFWTFFAVLFLICLSDDVSGQRWRLQRYEAGFSLGTTSSFMDIGSHLDGISSFQLNSSRISAGTHLGYKLAKTVTVKLDLNYLMLGAKDTPERDRGHVFMSQGLEHTLRMDIDLLTIGKDVTTAAVFNKRGLVNNPGGSHVYIFGGIGGLASKSTVRDIYGDEVIGNPSYYNNMQYGLVIPVGIMYLYEASTYLNLAFEAGGRFTLSDKVDGYEHSTASNYNDKYIVVNVKAIYNIRSKRNGLPDFSSMGRGGF